jgi:hypothetical protein
MTNTNPDSGNAPGLARYLADVQSRATRLHGIMAAVAFLENEGACADGRVALVFLAEELAADLNNALDSVNIPKGEIQ